MPALGNAVLLGDVTEASFVEHGLREVADRLSVPMVESWSDVPDDASCVIAVGAAVLASGGLPAIAVADDPGPEGYAIEVTSREGVPVVAVAGSDPRGTKFALLDLLRSVVDTGAGPTLPDDLARRTAPANVLRAMYAHLHWSYERPYALRSWTEDDWRSYVDLLSHLGANVLQIWPMLGLMPMPLSAQDEETLRMLARVVDYAHDARGMQVWVGECANNLASTDHGKPLADRSYFGAELLVDPGTPEGLAAIEESREHLYRVLHNADAYWIIDSDPGKWPGSPSSEFVEVFARNERLMRRHNTTGARMIYWMHVSWGTGTWEENFESTLRGLQERLEGDWGILLGALPSHVVVAERLGLLDKAIWFPYGWVEGEPTPPLTQLSFDVLDTYLAAGRKEGIDAAMGQAQTPIVQLPKLFYLFRHLWDPECGDDPAPHLRELGRLLHPDHGDALADAWLAMSGSDAEALGTARTALAAAVAEGLGRPGPLAECLFGMPTIVAEDLLAQIAIRHEGEAFLAAVRSEAAPEVVQDHFAAYLRAALRWRERHGYIPMGGFKLLYGAYLEPGTTGWNEYYDRLGMMHAYPEVQWVPKARLIEEGEFHWALVDAVLNEVVSQPGARHA